MDALDPALGRAEERADRADRQPEQSRPATSRSAGIGADPLRALVPQPGFEQQHDAEPVGSAEQRLFIEAVRERDPLVGS